jgi:cell division protein FtsB
VLIFGTIQDIKKMLKQLSFDWEHEAQKDLVYLHETQQILEEEIKRVTKLPAQIVVIDKDKILNREHEHQSNPLPF